MRVKENMQKFKQGLLFIGMILFLAGCQWIDDNLSIPTGHPSGTLINSLPDEKLDSTTLQTLQLFPLIEGSTWIYHYLGYDERGEVLWKVVETVVETRMVDGVYIAEINRKKEHLDGNIPDDFFNTPEVGSTWFMVDGDHVYQLASPWEPDPSTAELILILQLPKEGEGWYSNPELGVLDEPEKFGLRQASEPYLQTLPNGGIYTCYNIGTQIDDGVQEGTFCETVGYVFKELKYFHRAFGYRIELKDFSLQ
jgi:hypothetical protein